MRQGKAKVLWGIETLAAFCVIGFSATAFAGSVTGATITHLQVQTNYTEVFVSISAAKTGNPSCSANAQFGFVLPLTTTLETQMLAVLLAARASGEPVTLTGNGLCDTYPSVETLTAVYF